MTLKTVVESFETSVVEDAIYRYHNQAFIDLFETIGKIIREITEERT